MLFPSPILTVLLYDTAPNSIGMYFLCWWDHPTSRFYYHNWSWDSWWRWQLAENGPVVLLCHICGFKVTAILFIDSQQDLSNVSVICNYLCQFTWCLHFIEVIFSSTHYNMVYEMEQLSRYSPDRNILCSGSWSIFVCAHCSCCAYNSEMSMNLCRASHTDLSLPPSSLPKRFNDKRQTNTALGN
jgi:hypothetical protein